MRFISSQACVISLTVDIRPRTKILAPEFCFCYLKYLLIPWSPLSSDHFSALFRKFLILPSVVIEKPDVTLRQNSFFQRCLRFFLFDSAVGNAGNDLHMKHTQDVFKHEIKEIICKSNYNSILFCVTFDSLSSD